MNSNQLSWTPQPSRALTHGIPPSRSLKRPKLALPKSKVLILVIALLPPHRILNCTISWSLQPKLPPTFTSSTSPSLSVQGPAAQLHNYPPPHHSTPGWLLYHLCQNFITNALQEPLALCAPRCVLFPADVGKDEVPHENSGL